MKLSNVITGKFIEHAFLKERGIVLISMAVILLVYMFGLFLSFQTYNELSLTQKELSVMQAKYSTINAEKNRVTRESYLIDLLERKKINLVRSNQPPIKIE